MPIARPLLKYGRLKSKSANFGRMTVLPVAAGKKSRSEKAKLFYFLLSHHLRVTSRRSLLKTS